jgi:hypothetical protein
MAVLLYRAVWILKQAFAAFLIVFFDNTVPSRKKAAISVHVVVFLLNN